MSHTFKDIVAEEKSQLRTRRKKLGTEHGTAEQENWFGIALSGGGIRSATINLGFLKTLNKFGILQLSDYLSTVSGGGYTHAYVQGTAKAKGDFQQMFTGEQIDAMRKHGEYMIPGQGYKKNANGLLLTMAFAVSWLMSLISPAIVIGIAYYTYGIITALTGNPFEGSTSFMGAYENKALLFVGGLFLLHFAVNIALNFHLGISKYFNRAEMVLAVVGILIYIWVLLADIKTPTGIADDALWRYALYVGLLFIFGFFTNPNALSFHRFYRKQLADLFLRFSGRRQNMSLKDLFNADSKNKEDYVAPYPLINTCLNLQNPGGDDKFKGSKASDYFLLSPLFCGSKLTCYVPTERYWDYRMMTLPAAVTISAAAVNPGMGIYSNKLLSVLMTLFNFRLGFWISNPIILVKSYAIVWWPVYFFKELLGRIGLSNKMINISDGGHIENLGAYELLRRGCRLIIAFDAGEDKLYGFSDLNNLIIRARNELGLEIRFPDDQQPEDLIRPRPSQVYSRQRYAVAEIYQWWDDQKSTDFVPAAENEKGAFPNLKKKRKVGTFIYVKSSVMEPTGKPVLSEEEDRLKYGTYKYKIYHPDFPHEPTSDQFFDEIQWESYFQLGQWIGADVLGVTNLEQYDEAPAPALSVEQLIDWFDDRIPVIAVPGERGIVNEVEETVLESVKAGAAPEAPQTTATEEAVKYKM